MFDRQFKMGQCCTRATKFNILIRLQPEEGF